MSRVAAPYLRLFAFLTAAALGAFAAFAAPASAQTQPQVCRIATAENVTARQIMARPKGPCAPIPRTTRGTVWLDFGSPPDLLTGRGRYRLLIDNHRVHQVDAYFRRVDGVIEHVRYDPESPTREWRSGGYFTIPIQLHRIPVDRLVVRLGEVELITLSRPAKLVEVTPYIALERRDSALYGMAVGMLALTILFHLLLFFAIKRRFQLLYCAHVSMLLLHTLAYSGLILLAVPLSASLTSRLIAASLVAATASGLMFSTDFIERHFLPRWLRRWSDGGAVASVLTVALVMAAPDAWTVFAYSAANIAGLHALLLAMLVVGIGTLRGSRTARILAIGWTVPIVAGLMYPLRFAGFVPSGLPDGMMVVAFTIECLIVSLPVIDRVKRLRLDHERARERQQVLERQAATDALTGLANRRGFENAMERAVRLRGPDDPVALLMIDIDHFKALNDRYGHVRADAVLVDLGAHVGRTAGSGAIVARYGGEEFVVALVGLDRKRAATIAERIRRGIEDMRDDLLSATVSIGVACGGCGAIERLMVEADLALYDAKRAGRNRVAFAPSSSAIDPAVAA